MSDKRDVNWATIEVDYRAGIKPLRILAEEHGITHGAINKRAKRDGWTRDLAKKIKAAADAKVSKAVVSKQVSADTKVTEKLTVEANAEAVAQVRLAHRADIRKGRDLVAKLWDELTGVTDQPDLIEAMTLALAQSDNDPAEREKALRQALARVTSIPGRVGAIKGLAEAMKNLVALEREAWGIDDNKPEKEKEPMSPEEMEAALRDVRALRAQNAAPLKAVTA